jgi:hypothetical protein
LREREKKQRKYPKVKLTTAGSDAALQIGGVDYSQEKAQQHYAATKGVLTGTWADLRGARTGTKTSHRIAINV